MQGEVSRAPSYGVNEIEKALGGFITSRVGTEVSSLRTYKVEGKRADNLGTLPERMEKLTIVYELIAHGTAAVETCAAFSKLVTEHEEDTAEVVGDAAKCVADVSKFFHLVALAAQGVVGVVLCAEASRGWRVLVDVLGQVIVLLQYRVSQKENYIKNYL